MESYAVVYSIVDFLPHNCVFYLQIVSRNWQYTIRQLYAHRMNKSAVWASLTLINLNSIQESTLVTLSSKRNLKKLTRWIILSFYGQIRWDSFLGRLKTHEQRKRVVEWTHAFCLLCARKDHFEDMCLIWDKTQNHHPINPDVQLMHHVLSVAHALKDQRKEMRRFYLCQPGSKLPEE